MIKQTEDEGMSQISWKNCSKSLQIFNVKLNLKFFFGGGVEIFCIRTDRYADIETA